MKIKFKKLPANIQGEKSTNSCLNNWSISKSAKWTEPGVRKGRRSVMACRIRCKCSMITAHNSVKVKLGIKVIELVKSHIDWEVTVTGRMSFNGSNVIVLVESHKYQNAIRHSREGDFILFKIAIHFLNEDFRISAYPWISI